MGWYLPEITSRRSVSSAYSPSDDLKSGIPAAEEIPAPVTSTMCFAEPIDSVILSRRRCVCGGASGASDTRIVMAAVDTAPVEILCLPAGWAALAATSGKEE